jgi:hypothetical protein
MVNWSMRPIPPLMKELGIHICDMPSKVYCLIANRVGTCPSTPFLQMKGNQHSVVLGKFSGLLCFTFAFCILELPL